MTPTHPQAPSRHFPAEAPSDRDCLQSRVDLLNDRRKAGAATTIVMAAVLPFAMAWHTTYVAAIVACLIGSGLLWIGCHVARKLRLTILAMYPQYAHLPELAGTRKRLVSPRSRRALAQDLRRTAAGHAGPNRFIVCPLLADRVAAARAELINLAAAIEQHPAPDHIAVALLHELLRDGASPLYSTNVPAADLHATLRNVRIRLPSPRSGVLSAEANEEP